MADAGLANAIINRNMRVLKYLLASGVPDLDADQGDLLRLAVCLRNDEAVGLLLSKGASVHFRDDEVLKLAVVMADEKIVAMLLKSGASPRADNDAALKEAVPGSRIEQMLQQAIKNPAKPPKPPRAGP